jgi:hypothetical protein
MKTIKSISAPSPHPHVALLDPAVHPALCQGKGQPRSLIQCK